MPTTASDILKQDGQPVLLKLEQLWDEAQVVDGVESPSARAAYGLAAPIPDEAYEATKAEASRRVEAMSDAFGGELPDALREKYEAMVESLPQWALVSHEPLILVWN